MYRWVSSVELLKIALGFLVIFCVLFVLASCKFTELVFYEHGPSKEFYENYDIDEPALQPFIDDGVLFVVDVKAATHEEYFIWLGLYSERKGRSVVIKRVILSNDANEESAIFNTTLLISEPVNKAALYQNPQDTLKLFEVGENSLGGVSGAAKTVFLKVFYEIDGKEGVMNYELKRRVEKQNVFPT